jgi:hypothetical protein
MWRWALALPLFSATLFISAFILFLVQPIIGKLILPMLGGTPQVWNTCMVFFQTALLAGYGYTHTATTRLPVRKQLIVHCCFLVLPLIFLFPLIKYVGPVGRALIDQQQSLIEETDKATDVKSLAEKESFLARQVEDTGKEADEDVLQGVVKTMKTAEAALKEGNKSKALEEQKSALAQMQESLAAYPGPFNFRAWEGSIPLGGNPIVWALGLLTLLVGMPFFVVATSSPLLQRWFVHTGHEAAKDPYFLSIASNIGSLLALLAYPVVLEPYLTLNEQKWTWTIGYVLLAGLVMVCASTVWKSAPVSKEPVPEPAKEPTPAPAAAPTPPPPPAAPAATQPVKPQQTGISRKKFGKGKQHGPGPAHAVAAGAPPRTPVVDYATQAAMDLAQRSRPITPWRRLRWVLLGAAPSSLMLGIVTYICTDLSPIPLLWIIPLALYLLSFILVFANFPKSVRLGAFTIPAGSWTGMPHTVVLFLQPILILLLCVMLQQSFASHLNFLGWFSIPGPVLHISLAMLAFFATALVCHGEMAKDRPEPRHLTEFYLWMSVGGMVGGIFNGLVAPLLFWGVAEFPLAIVLGVLLRPTQRGDGWSESALETYFPNLVTWFKAKGNELAAAYKRPEPNSTYALNYTLDVVLPILLGLVSFLLIKIVSLRGLANFFRNISSKNGDFLALRTYDVIVLFVPLVICFLFFRRPLRLGLAVGALLLVQVVYQQAREEASNSKTIYANRSYFGVLRVREERTLFMREPNVVRSLMHGSTHHGLNYQKGRARRLATTYYHQYGPAGMVMLKFNWFKDGFPEVSGKPADNDTWTPSMLAYTSDARIQASIAGMGALGTLGIGLPLPMLVDAWSEPPFATIGLGTGTMASYGRPLQHVHYYEIDRQIRRLSLPENDLQMYKDPETGDLTPYFNYLGDAIKRGAIVQVRMGDARLRMAYPYAPYNEDKEKLGESAAGGPVNFYHMMVVDAFSSDAIPIHLITVEAIKMYMDKLVPDGILCVHTSNRHVDLVPVVDMVVEAIRNEPNSKMPNLACLRAHDSAPWSDRAQGGAPGQFTSEWVMVARNIELLKGGKDPTGKKDMFTGEVRKLDELKVPPLYEKGCIDVIVARYKEFGATQERIDQAISGARANGEFEYWSPPKKIFGLRPWTDNYSNVFSVFRW